MTRGVKLLWALVFFLLASIGVLGAKLMNIPFPGFGSAERYYAAVYVNSGEIYFGELTTAPSLTLSNAHFLQKDTSGNYSVSKFEDALYGPSGTIRLNPDHVVWISPLKNESQVMNLLEVNP